MADEASDFNSRIIDEFRANEGKVGPPFEGAPLLLLHSTGAKSGKERVSPMVFQKVDGGYAVFASKAGAPTNPDWYHNLTANPEASLELGTETVEVTAREVTGDDRHPIWDAQKEAMPGFADYETKTDRTIPVLVLEPT